MSAVPRYENVRVSKRGRKAAHICAKEVHTAMRAAREDGQEVDDGRVVREDFQRVLLRQICARHSELQHRARERREGGAGGRTADEVRRDLAVARGVEDLLHARALAQLLRADLVARRGEREERVHVRPLAARAGSAVGRRARGRVSASRRRGDGAW